ncbi:hypothetical protein SteCoe_31656 [Stentor coeruleus]|uniref:EF-hand domain-containing protein n=1 Tax=Stentor coeruleus TaxID=5963 RepID=A0A1R2B0S3_9CILI|nr:hypothetical protein SteCoe_31656 [Stentor coeruleus]
MEIPDNLYTWLKSTNLFNLPSDSNVIPADLIYSFESGHAFTKLIKRLNQIKVFHKQNQLDRVSTPMPEINTLKQALTPAAKLYNWNILSQALQLFNINLDPDTKSLIIGGDREMLIEVLNQLYIAEGYKIPQSITKNPYKPTQASDGGLIIENIDENKSLSETESCLEFLIVSFCHSFSLKPKQGAGLLAQGFKFLAHIIAKGLKGDFDPVKIWLHEIYSNTNKLTELVQNELSEGSVQCVMNAIKAGIISKDQEVVELTFTLITKLALDFGDKYLINELWSWFTNDSILGLCFIAIKRLGLPIYHNLLEMLLHVGQNNYLELFTQQMRNTIIDAKEYIQLIDEFLPFIIESKTVLEEIVADGVVGFWVDFGVKEAEDGKPNDLRAVALNFNTRCLKYFVKFIGDDDVLVNNILGVINRSCRDESLVIRIMGISDMFYILEFLSEINNTFAPVVYRMLTFLLVENFTSQDVREFIMGNFVVLFKMNSSIPITILLEPLIKRLQVSEISLEVFDYDFISIIAQYPRLNIKHAILLIDIVGKVYINDFIYSKAAGVSYTYLASSFIQNETMREYLFMFCKYGFTIVLNTEKLIFKKDKKTQVALIELSQQRNRILDMISWVVQQWQESLNEKIKENLLQNCFNYYDIAKKHSNAFLAILGLFGDSSDLLSEYEAENKKIALLQTPIEEIKEIPTEEENALALVPIVKSQSKPLLPKKKAPFPWDRAAKDIEKAKRKKQEKDQKIRDEEEKKKQSLDFKKKQIKQQLEIRKLEQNIGKQTDLSPFYEEGVIQKLIITPEEIQLREFIQAESDLLEAVNTIILKYSRVFKTLFSKYSGTGFARKAQHKSEFESLADRKSKIYDGEYIKMLKDHNIIPNLLTKTELQTIMRFYNHKIAKQAEQNYVDYEGFKGVFCQLAYFVYSRKPQDYSHLPPVISVKLLLDQIQSSIKSKGISTEIFDEPDPGTGDKDVVKSLNKLLAKDPNTLMPDGYKRIQDKEIQIVFCVPECLDLEHSYKSSIEILDSLLFSKFGVRILEPQVQYMNIYRAKGFAPKLDKIREPSPLEKPVPERSSSKSRSRPILPSSQGIKISPTLKICIANASTDDKTTYEICASLLEDILLSVQLKMKRLISRKPKGLGQEEKFESKKEKEKKDEDAKKTEDDRKRKIRQQQLLEELNKAKEEREKKLKSDEEKRKYEMILAENRKKELDEKARKERDEKARMIYEWNKKKEEDGKKIKEDEEIKKKNDAENVKKLEEAKRRNQERLDEMLKEKQQKLIEQKNEEAKKLQQEKELKERKRAQSLNKLRLPREKDEKIDEKKEEILVLNNSEVKNLLNQNSSQLDCIFTYYIGLLGKDMPHDGTLPWGSFDKFCTQFGIYSYTQQDQALKIFKNFTKKKSLQTLTFDEFKSAIALLANKSKSFLGFEDTGKALGEFLKITELNETIKDLKNKLKRMNMYSGKRKRGTGVSQERNKKVSLEVGRIENIEKQEKSDDREDRESSKVIIEKQEKSDDREDKESSKVISPKGIIEEFINENEEKINSAKEEEDNGGGLFD